MYTQFQESKTNEEKNVKKATGVMFHMGGGLWKVFWIDASGFKVSSYKV